MENTIKTKYTYLKVIQQNYGFGWEDNSEYQTTSNGKVLENSLFIHDLKEYKLTGYATRVINRKTTTK